MPTRFNRWWDPDNDLQMKKKEKKICIKTETFGNYEEEKEVA